MNDARTKYKEGRFEQALVQAQRAKELDPDNTAADALIFQSNTKIASGKPRAEQTEKTKNVLERTGRPPAVRTWIIDNPLQYDEEHWNDRVKDRKAPSIFTQTKDPVERAIERRLETPESFHWKDTSLQQIISGPEGDAQHQRRARPPGPAEGQHQPRHADVAVRREREGEIGPQPAPRARPSSPT